MEIRMVPEVQEWLAEMRDRDPAAAEGVDEAVAALRAGGTSVGPPLVVPVEGRPGSGASASAPNGRRRAGRAGTRGRSAAGAARWLLARTALPALDAAYERQLDRLTPVRRTVADVATSRKRLELQIEHLERQGDGPGGPTPEDAGERLADLRRRYAALQAEEECVTVASQRLQATVDDFRTHMEAAKAAYRAAQEAADATWAELDRDDGASPAGGCGPGRAAPFWLNELRPGTPESAGARLLFTVEPSGAAVLLAAATDEDRQDAWYAEAIARSRIRYQRTVRHRA
jgi:hypothetical protein